LRLRRPQREQQPAAHVFSTERGGPMTPKGFNTLFGRIGERAGMPFPVHPHVPRHACGYALANAGHDTRALQAYLGHKNIQHTVRYTELAPDRFKDFWHKRLARHALAALASQLSEPREFHLSHALIARMREAVSY
jgi:site-specific recombinase XerD